MAGNWGTPLVKKLGIKAGSRVRTDGAPDDYLELVGPLPDSVVISNRLRTDVDLYHPFIKSRRRLAERLPTAMTSIRQDGMIWYRGRRKPPVSPLTSLKATFGR